MIIYIYLCVVVSVCVMWHFKLIGSFNQSIWLHIMHMTLCLTNINISSNSKYTM